MTYFRADTLIIAKMIDKDCLRYTADNTPTLITIFSIKSKSTDEVFLAVKLTGDDAEINSKKPLIENWFEITGELIPNTPQYAEYPLPAISVKAKTIRSLPIASSSLVYCEVVGRLTNEPEHVVKSNTYEFVRYSLAVNRPKSEKVSYFDISVFRQNLIKLVKEHTHKGQTVFSSGELAFYKQGTKKVPSYSIKLDRLVTFEK